VEMTGGDAGCDDGLDPKEGDREERLDTSRVIPPRVDSSVTSLLTLVPVVSTGGEPGNVSTSAMCALSFKFARMGYRFPRIKQGNQGSNMPPTKIFCVRVLSETRLKRL